MAELRKQLQSATSGVTSKVTGNSGATGDVSKNAGANVRKGLSDAQNQIRGVVKDATDGIKNSVKQVRDSLSKATGTGSGQQDAA